MSEIEDGHAILTDKDLDAIETRLFLARAVLGGYSNSREPLIVSVKAKEGMESCLRKIVFDDVSNLLLFAKIQLKKEASK